MKFDLESTVEDFRSFPDEEIAKHKKRHDEGKFEYIGPTRSKMRQSKNVNCVMPGAEYAGDGSDSSDSDRIDSIYLQSSYSQGYSSSSTRNTPKSK
jgi:hypothetical protein